MQIAINYLAVVDEEVEAIDGHTIEGRVEHFIQELALILRAHNWNYSKDRKRKREENKEHDDLKGDKPSCYSGMNRRLFQSVLGHPLFKTLTIDHLFQEIRSFAWEHFYSVLNSENRCILKDSYNNYFIYLDEEFAKPLVSLNIPLEKKGQFADYLDKKYGSRLTQNTALRVLIYDTLILRDNPIRDRYHALKLDGLTQFSNYLINSPSSGVREAGFFAEKKVKFSEYSVETILKP